MKIAKGFIEILSLIDTTSDVVAALGELGPLRATYARDVKKYSRPSVDVSEYTLNLFLSQDGTGADISFDNTMKGKIFDIIDWVVTQGSGAGWPTLQQFLYQINVNFESVGTNWSAGQLIPYGGFILPDYISWDVDDGAGGFDKAVFWFSDNSFKTQYRDSTIIVIPPTTPDNLFNSYVNVQALMDAYTTVDIADAVETAKGEYPYTKWGINVYSWHNPNGVSPETVDTNWAFIVYGAGGLNEDAKRDAIIDYILANSTHTREEWTVVLPTLFNSTEMTMVPLWNRIAIPEETDQSGTYSSITKKGDILDYCKLAVSFSDSFIELAGRMMQTTYNGLAMAVVGNPENLNGLISIDQIFPKYMPISTLSSDFGRLPADTQAWMSLINDMLVYAATLTDLTALPSNISVLERSGVTYVSSRYNEILYLIATKDNAIYN